jgi:uncharacterized membrane protein
MATKDDDKRVFDVAKAGKSEPAATSRPVIVGHKNMIEDPMVTAPASSKLDVKSEEPSGDAITVKHDNDSGDTPEIMVHAGKTVTPPEPTVSEQPKEKEPVAEPTDTPATDTEAETPAETQESEKEDKEAAPDTTGGAVEAVANQAGAKKKTSELTAEEKARQTAIQKLIESKQYAVKIGATKGTRSTHRLLLVLLVVLVLSLVGADLLIDAGLIRTDIKPVVDLIKN